MKTLRITLLLFVGSALMLSSCDKDDDITTETALQRLQQKWNVDSSKIVYHTPPTQVTFEYTGQAADYYDFRTDGKLYSSVNGTLDTVLYNLINNNTLVVNNNGAIDTGNITTLTSTKLVGTTIFKLTGNNYNEVTLNLSR